MRMSSGASAAYEKPRSGRSSCIDETPRSSRIAVGAHAVAGELREHLRELAVQEPHLDRGRAPQPLEVRRDRRVAVDRDQLALAAQPPDEQLGVAAGAEGAVDDRLARAGVERGEHLVARGRGRDQSRLARRSATSSALPSASCMLLAPRGAIPDLEVVVDAGDRRPRARSPHSRAAWPGSPSGPALSSSTGGAPVKK